jgi:U32 family peptidase
MNDAPTRPELLAPARNLQTLLAALHAGADAVYVGLRHLSARAHAANVSLSELSRGVSAARATGARVYVALNTLVRPEELSTARALLIGIRDAGAHGVIVQDLGVLALAAEVAPDLPRHASTQLAVRSAGGARALVAAGVQRVVLARELDVAAIAEIVAAVPAIEVEVFVHGALCYGASGLCLLSAQTTGRSGNRGRCTQPCRRPFASAFGRTGNALNLTDLWGLPYVAALARAGVRALKIEGRLRSVEYVTAVVRTYRAALDGELARAGDQTLSHMGPRAIGSLFSRRMSGGYLGGPHAADRAFVDPQFQGHRGYPAGRTLSSPIGQLRILVTAPFGPHDQLLIERPHAPPYNLELPAALLIEGGSAGLIATTGMAGVGDVVCFEDPPATFSPHREVFLVTARDVQAACAAPPLPPSPPQPVPLTVSCQGDVLHLTARCGRESITAAYPLPSERRYAPLDLRDIATLLCRAEDAAFVVSLAEVRGEGRFRVPPKAIRRVQRDFLRRVTLAGDASLRAAPDTLPAPGPRPPAPPAAPRWVVRVDRPTHLIPALLHAATSLEILAHGDAGDDWLQHSIGSLVSALPPHLRHSVAIALAPVLTVQAERRHGVLLRAAWRAGVRRFVAGGLDAVGLIRAVLPPPALITADHTLYTMNPAAAQTLATVYGVPAWTLPLEADRALALSLVATLGARLTVLAYGDPPLLRGTLPPAPLDTSGASDGIAERLLYDERGTALRVVVRGAAETWVSLARPYSLAGHIRELRAVGARLFRIEFAHRSYSRAAIRTVLTHLQTDTPVPDSHAGAFAQTLGR